MKSIVSVITALSIILNPITLDRYKTISNNTGKLIFDGTSVSYQYCSEASYEVSNIIVSADVPVVFTFYANIVLPEPVSVANITINFSTASTSNWPLNFVLENARCVSSNYNTLTIQAYNTDTINLCIILTLKQLHDNYGYAYTTSTQGITYDDEWTAYGYRYFDITSISLTSATQLEGEYIPKLNNIINAVDGIEGLLTNIANNTNSLSNINTNIADIENYLNAINTKLDNIDNTLDTITWLDTGATYKGWTEDYTTFDSVNYGNHSSGYYVFENPQFGSPYNNGIYKLTLGLGNAVTTINNITFFQYWENDFRQFYIDSYLYVVTRNRIEIYFTVNETYHTWPQAQWPLCIHVDKQLYKYSAQPMKLEYILSTDIEYWTLYKAIKDKMILDNIDSKLEDILSILGDITVNSSDLTDKQTVDNFYERLKQQLIYPTIPGNDRLVPVLKEMVSTYGELINMEELSMFKWSLMIMAVFVVLKVIL